MLEKPFSQSPCYYYTTAPVRWPLFHDNLGKPAPET